MYMYTRIYVPIPNIQKGTSLFEYSIQFPLIVPYSDINFFHHFHVLITETNYYDFECFLIVVTHSQGHRGQMSQICDISPLSVNDSSSWIPNFIEFLYKMADEGKFIMLGGLLCFSVEYMYMYGLDYDS